MASDDSDGGAEDGEAGPSSESSQYCCVSGAYYVCPSAAVFAKCASICTRDPSNDSTCGSFSSGSGVGGSAPMPPATPTNACGGLFPGFACSVGGDCNGLGHCTQNLCFPNEPGSPCTYPSDCGNGNHCTNGCCASPANGSACTAYWDCDSGTCNNGVCQ